MEKSMTKMEQFLNWFTEKRNMLFLTVCLITHAAYMCAFYLLGIWLLSILNFLSSCFYFYFLFIKKDTSENSMTTAYFEILVFSFLSELALGPDYGFFLYIIGMAAAVFFLIPSYGNKRFLYQVLGIIVSFLVKIVVLVAGISFPSMQQAAAPYRAAIYLVNLGILASIIMAATFFYSKETEKVWESLRYNMNHDVLTGLYNRRFFEHQMEHTSYSERGQYVISMLDIDYFKKVNDTYGHEAGDEVLVNTASCLKNAADKENLAVRWGGEEFILYFPKSTLDTIYPLMESLRKQIESTVVRVAGKEIRVTVTIGIATGLEDSNYEKVIQSADEKLYLGKQRGRNRVIK